MFSAAVAPDPEWPGGVHHPRGREGADHPVSAHAT
jgi:hypothetical protein